MSFLFKSSKKQQGSALPAATRNIRSADGPAVGSQIPTLNGAVSPRDARTPAGPSPTPGASVNHSLNSLGEKISMRSLDESGAYPDEKTASTPSPEQKVLRSRSDSEQHGSRMAPAPSRPPPDSSPYPWSQRRLDSGAPSTHPFPRYGAAVNSVASKDGAVYVMGGLINGSTVKGDLWMVEASHQNPNCYPVATTSEGPGPRVGHASLLVGNAFIVFGGDTKTEESDMLDDTLYLLNTSTKQWSRAAPAGPRPPGRYGHSLNILGSKIYIFGGQVEGFFFNDLVAFDLNALQQASNRWEILIQNTFDGGPPHGQIPPARTNHSMVTWNDKLYLFGGTDGVQWFNDVWSYDPRTNSWTQLECIGYIPAAREGHAAALVGDVMYVFGGRTEEGNDLGDLAAFRISSRRWYTFQNMGPSPSPRSGHSMTASGKHIVVLGGEPSSAPRDASELSLIYFLDTSKIRYPVDSHSQAPPDQRIQGHRRPSGGEKTGIPQARQLQQREHGDSPTDGPRRIRENSIPPANRGIDPRDGSSRLPRAPGMQPPSDPVPQQPRMIGPSGNRQPTRPERALSPTSEQMGAISAETRRVVSPPPTDSPVSRDPFPVKLPGMPGNFPETPAGDGSLSNSFGNDQNYFQGDQDSTPQTYKPTPPAPAETAGPHPLVPPSRSSSRNNARQHKSQPSVERLEETPRPSMDARPSMDRSTSLNKRTASRQDAVREEPVDSGVGSSPALSQRNDDLSKELEAERSKNAWYTSELALARKAGYTLGSSNSSVLDERAADAVDDEDRPLIEALLKMRAELTKIQSSIDSHAASAAERIAEVEKQRDAAINEAVFAKAKLAAQSGGSPNLDRGDGGADSERSNEINKRLAAALAAQNELQRKTDSLAKENEAEKQARQLAEDTADAAQKRVTELDTDRQRNASEIESLRAELHEAQKTAREEAANCAEAVAAHKLISVDKNELNGKLERALAETQNHISILDSLKEAVTASTDKAALLEQKLEEERRERESLEQKLIQLRAQHEERTNELETTARRLRDAEELAEKHADEARTHRQAVLDGLAKVTDRSVDDSDAVDERVTILHQQVEAANAMVRQNQAAADSASEKLRSAEERIAGLEAYQEQASREGLSIRKQLQLALRNVKSLNEEKADLQQQLQSQQLETNAIAVQHGALKDILAERGINPSEVRRSRGLDSPSSQTSNGRFGTPDIHRVRELEQQLEASLRSHDEMKAQFEEVQDREGATRREYEDKLSALDNDHQAAVKYLRGTEKMLSKMKQELQRVKNQAADYHKELEAAKAKESSRAAETEAPPVWEQERESLRKDLESVQKDLISSKSALESRITKLQSELQERHEDLETLRTSHKDTQSNLTTLHATHERSRADLERLQRENSVLEERARDAENKVQLLLDQVESSVDNYRRQSQSHGLAPNMNGHGHRRGLSDVSNMTTSTMNHDGPHHTRGASFGGDSVYSASGATETQSNNDDASDPHRNSMALDSLASELDALRSHWETTNKQHYRLSDRFDFERTPTQSHVSGEFGSLANWRRGLAEEEDDDDDVTRPSTAGTEQPRSPRGKVDTAAAAAAAAGTSAS